MKITDIQSLVHKPGFYRVSVDNKALGYVDSTVVTSLGLAINKTISEEDYQVLIKQIKFTSLYNKAIRYADRRLRSKQEVIDFLRVNGSEGQMSIKIVDRLIELSIIDEQKLAEAYIHDVQLSRPLSRSAIKLKLRQKKIPENIIDQVLTKLKQTDHDSLDLLIHKKAKSYSYINNQPKLFRYLLRQGFSYQDIAARIGCPKQD